MRFCRLPEIRIVLFLGDFILNCRFSKKEAERICVFYNMWHFVAENVFCSYFCDV